MNDKILEISKYVLKFLLLEQRKGRLLLIG
jgi:hypothetical protein